VSLLRTLLLPILSLSLDVEAQNTHCSKGDDDCAGKVASGTQGRAATECTNLASSFGRNHETAVIENVRVGAPERRVGVKDWGWNHDQVARFEEVVVPKKRILGDCVGGDGTGVDAKNLLEHCLESGTVGVEIRCIEATDCFAAHTSPTDYVAYELKGIVPWASSGHYLGETSEHLFPAGFKDSGIGIEVDEGPEGAWDRVGQQSSH
tara:strand:+ start:5479 stop:6099 length:621 start_codon:yes stop_codon:yes gene_type:complete